MIKEKQGREMDERDKIDALIVKYRRTGDNDLYYKIVESEYGRVQLLLDALQKLAQN